MVQMKLLTLFLTLLLITTNLFAKVTLEKLDEYDKFHRQYAVLSISNEITPEDAKAFQDAMNVITLENLHVKYDSVVLDNSAGGNIVTANKIGKIIREYKLSTWVPKDKYCSSACVNVFIGGICRMGQGRISIHRSFSAYEFKEKRSLERVQRSLDKYYKEDADYLLEMDVRPSLGANANEIPYWTSKVLTHTEKLDYGFYSTVESYELHRMEEVAMNTGKSKDDLMASLVNRYHEINPTKPPSKLKQFLTNKFGIAFKKDDPKYLRCSEQLFLTDSY